DVQNKTCDVPALQPGSGAADWPPPPQAQTNTTSEISEALRPRPGSNVIAFSSVAMTVDPAPSSRLRCSPDRGESAPARSRDYSTAHDPDGPFSKLTLQI